MRVSEYQAPVLNAAHAAPLRAAQSGRPTAPPPATRADRVNVSANPYEGFAPSAATVTVDRWRQGPNDSIERILRKQGYSLDEIYNRDSNGQRLIERVAQANGLRDPNLIRPGRKLTVPSKQAPAQQQAPAAQAPAPAAQAPAPAAQAPSPAAQAPASAAQAPAPAAQAPAPAAQAPAPAAQAPAPVAQAPAAQAPAPPAQAPAPAAQAPAPAAQAAAPAAQAPAPAAQAPQVATPATPPANTNANADNNATVEIGLLLDGVNQKKFTRDEFQALNSAANQYTELRARDGKDGFSQEELMRLGRVEKQYGQMYAKFWQHDRSRIRFAGQDGQDPATRQRVGQLEEAGRTYDDLSAQRIDAETFITRLMQQREAARRLGEQ